MQGFLNISRNLIQIQTIKNLLRTCTNARWKAKTKIILIITGIQFGVIELFLALRNWAFNRTSHAWWVLSILYYLSKKASVYRSIGFMRNRYLILRRSAITQQHWKNNNLFTKDQSIWGSHQNSENAGTHKVL